MDEPTAALSSREVEDLYRITRRLTSAGTAILFISHKLDEILAIADHFVVFRDGSSVAQGAITDVDEDRLVHLMVGRTITEIFPKTKVELGEPVLESSATAPSSRTSRLPCAEARCSASTAWWARAAAS